MSGRPEGPASSIDWAATVASSFALFTPLIGESVLSLGAGSFRNPFPVTRRFAGGAEDRFNAAAKLLGAACGGDVNTVLGLLSAGPLSVFFFLGIVKEEDF